MTKKKKTLLCDDNLRHAEYYNLQESFDNLYARSKSGEVFTDLMSLILSRENILLAYRNIKTNTGSKTAGTDKLKISDIAKLSAEEVVQRVRFIVQGSPHGYRPKPVRRKEIPKPYDPSKMRPLGIPCIWDRLIQQCVKQVLEPICEAKFSENSYGFRPNRSAEHAIASCSQKMMLANLHFVIEFDIKGFFDNVNHSKLIKQIWALGIHDKHLIYVLKKMLTAPIKMIDGNIMIPDKGTPQGGIISPLLANIVLNELDHWIDDQWIENPVGNRYIHRYISNGTPNRGHAYRAMRTTKLKEMYIVRYADDFRIFCRSRDDAERTKIAVTQWLKERLKLEISEKKTRIVNLKRHYSEFLGFKMKVHPKGNKKVMMSHIADKNLSHKKQALLGQAKRIAHPRSELGEAGEIRIYNSMVLGIQNYYQIATHISCDCNIIFRSIMTVLTNRLRTDNGTRLVKSGRKLTDFEKERYGNTPMWRYVSCSKEPIYPIGKIQHKHPIGKKKSICCYTAEGRAEIHDNLSLNMALIHSLMRTPQYDKSIEFVDNRISLYSAQMGKCAVTGEIFTHHSDISCHHIIPREKGSTDKYDNLILIKKSVHLLIHAVTDEAISIAKSQLDLNKEQLRKINLLREKAMLAPIS